MKTSPTVYCPFCGTPLKVLDAIPAVTAEGTINISVCKCGVMDVIVKHDKIVAIRLRNPERQPVFRILNT